jgi:hypothetical protein
MIVLNSVPLSRQIRRAKEIILPIINKCKLAPVRMSEWNEGIEIVWVYPPSYMTFANIYAYVNIMAGGDGRATTSFRINKDGKEVFMNANFHEFESWIADMTERFIEQLEKIATEVGAI